MFLGILISLSLTTTCAFAQIILTHLFRPRRIINLMGGLFFVSLPIFIGIYSKTSHAPSLLDLANSLLVYTLLYCNYIEGFYCVSPPITLRILEEFLKAPAGGLRISELRENYGLKQVIDPRLKNLLLNGYVRKERERYLLTKKGKLFVGVFRAFRRILGVPHYLDEEIIEPVCACAYLKANETDPGRCPTK